MNIKTSVKLVVRIPKASWVEQNLITLLRPIRLLEGFSQQQRQDTTKLVKVIYRFADGRK
jgi:hypothetical protein